MFKILQEAGMAELITNSSILVVAGSETTATVLGGVSYFLVTNPDKLTKLTAEVRSAFHQESDITIVSVGKLGYMLACLDEALRLYPPVPIGLPRIVPKGGRLICGHLVPEGVSSDHLLIMSASQRTNLPYPNY